MRCASTFLHCAFSKVHISFLLFCTVFALFCPLFLHKFNKWVIIHQIWLFAEHNLTVTAAEWLLHRITLRFVFNWVDCCKILLWVCTAPCNRFSSYIQYSETVLNSLCTDDNPWYTLRAWVVLGQLGLNCIVSFRVLPSTTVQCSPGLVASNPVLLFT